MSIKSYIVNHSKIFAPLLKARKYLLSDRKRYVNVKRLLQQDRNGQHRIYYLGVPVHANLGDLAQGMCIRKWLKKHYASYQIVEIETNALVNTHMSTLSMLKADYKNGDFLIFQSGYTTTDLGGYADEMHREVMKTLPNAKMLMFPQTIFFKSKDNENRTSECYNSMFSKVYPII